MIIRSAKEKQSGTSLVELLIASTLGFIALILIGTVYIKGQSLYADRSQKLLLIQELNDALRFIKDESYRAGYNGESNYSAILSGASNIIHIDGSKLSYVYKVENDPEVWRGVSVKYESKTIKICTKSNLLEIPDINFCHRYYSLLDNGIIEVTDFSLEQTSIGHSVSSATLSILTNAKLKNTAHQYSSKIKLIQRNWK